MSVIDYNNTNSSPVSDKRLVRFKKGSLGGVQYTQITCKEVTMTESLLTPGLQTTATFQSQIYKNKPFKNWDDTKNQDLEIEMENDMNDKMSIKQKIYRLDNREFNPVNTGYVEEMTFHACDETLLKDAQTLVSKSWKCTTPDEIVRYVLTTCLKAEDPDVQEAKPGRDYVAEMIHPFQVIQQQANVALDGDDPSFVHYMTYGEGQDWTPKHHFKSLKKLCDGEKKARYKHSDLGPAGKKGYHDEDYDGFEIAIHFMFPCDYDYLSDLLNGVGEDGGNLNSMSTMNASDASGSYLNGQMSGCIKNTNFKQSMTNKGTADQQNACETDVEKHLLMRQARMGLLEKDKVALRLVVPWAPDLHAGDIIEFKWKDKEGGQDLYGSGDYLIASMTHRIQMGGYATTTLDCVSKTVGQGKV